MKHCERKSPNLLVLTIFQKIVKKKDLTDRAKRVTYKKNQDYFLHEFGDLGEWRGGIGGSLYPPLLRMYDKYFILQDIHTLSHTLKHRQHFFTGG